MNLDWLLRVASSIAASSQFARFVLSGIVNVVITYAIYVLLLSLSPYYIAFTISYLVGIALSFAVNRALVFASLVNWTALAPYVLLYASAYALSLALVMICVEVLGVWDWLAPLPTAATTLVYTYLGSRLIFSRPRPTM